MITVTRQKNKYLKQYILKNNNKNDNKIQLIENNLKNCTYSRFFFMTLVSFLKFS